MKTVRIVIASIAVLAALSGLVWLLQGLGFLPGSFMSGQLRWALYGALLLAASAAAIFWATRQPGVGLVVQRVVGVLLLLIGLIWALQGLNLLGGSPMSGRIGWTYGGGVLAVLAALWVVRAFRRHA